jgi:integrase
MPIQLVKPRAGLSPYYRGRGHFLDVYVDRSTKVRTAELARKIIRTWEHEIQSGRFGVKTEPTFASAALTYMQAGGERRPLVKLLPLLGDTKMRLIDQAAIDNAAVTLLPNATAATRNREVYTPISAVAKHNGYEFKIKRPKGWRGKIVREWLWPEQAWRIVHAAQDLDAEVGLLVMTAIFTGLRISELLSLRCGDLRLQENFAWARTSKNGEPQPLHLPNHLVTRLENHPRGLDRPGERVFRFHRGGGLSFKLIQACAVASGLPLPKRIGRGSPWPVLADYEFDFVSWHTFRRTYATWMRRYGDLDDKALVDTGRWKTIESASRYSQTVVSEAARAADLLPAPPALRLKG